VAILLFLLLPISLSAQAPQATALTEAHRQEIIHTHEAMTTADLAATVQRAERGDVEAQLLAGMTYRAGKVVTRDFNQAIEWFRKAAAKNHPMAQNVLGLMYASGEGVPADPAVAVQWFGKAAAQGYGAAQSNLGWVYYTGSGTTQNPAEAVRLFRLASEQGNASGQNRLATAYFQGAGVQKDERQAFEWYRKAAEQGEALAQRNLAQMYNYGIGIKRDFGEAARWYRKAAEQGDALAQLDVAVAYYTGEGVKKDKDEAEKWLRKSSEQGYAIGTFYLARWYMDRRDPLSHRAAMDKFELAAKQGYPVAAYRLGLLRGTLLAPHPIGKDTDASCTWYVIASALDKRGDWAAQQPDDMAEMRKDLPDRIEKSRHGLGAERFAACERRAAEWMAALPAESRK
jgi:uncharacterized protein